MASELTWLGWSVVLLIVHILAQASAARRELGLEYQASARDEGREARAPIAGRTRRALTNFLETYPAFVAMALGLVVAGKAGGMGALGALVWFIARVVYLPLYAAGVPVARSIAFAVSIVGLLMMVAKLLT